MPTHDRSEGKVLVLVAGVVLVVAAAALVLVAVLDDDEPTTPPPAAQPAGEVENPLGPPEASTTEPWSPPPPVGPESGGPAPASPDGETVEVDFSGTIQLVAAFARVGGMGGAAAYAYSHPGFGVDWCQNLAASDSSCDAATLLTSELQAQCLVLRDGIVALWAVDEPTHIPNNKATFTAWFGTSWDEYVGIGTGSNAGKVVVTGGRSIGGKEWEFGGSDEAFVLTAGIPDGFDYPAAWVQASWTGEAVENASGEKSAGSIDIKCLFAFPG